MFVKANPSNTLPSYSLDELNGIIEIKGRSIAVEADEFFKPILEYLQNFLNYNPMDITISINLEYFNTKTSRILLQLFYMVKKTTDINECKMTVNWYYDKEEDTYDIAGHDYESILGMKFNFVQN